ncbi:polyprenyl synthetase family protein [Streptomyces sp. NPDC059688]|uniref:polyprenyl synthetase family protein n=1 Tax=Streptomyces sp. NPDC059688 TaxID=3346906 RepID=UPI003689D53C
MTGTVLALSGREAPAEVLACLTLPRARAERFEELLTDAALGPVPSLSAALSNTVRRTGKRLRPGLLMAFARAAGADSGPRMLRRAAAVELLHLASLVHDDLMDDATTRGGLPTIHRTHLAAGAVVGGDRLLAAAGLLLADAGPEAHRVWSAAFLEMCDGQALESAHRHRLIPPAEYLRQVRGKTAALISAACVLGVLADRPQAPASAAADAAARYGTCLGVVFQIADDLMDVLSTSERWGKPVEHDVPQGVYTLPVLLAARAPGGEKLAGLLQPEATARETAAAYGIVRRSGVTPALAVARAWAARAARTLDMAGFTGQLAADLGTLPARYLESVLAHAVPAAHARFVDVSGPKTLHALPPADRPALQPFDPAG